MQVMLFTLFKLVNSVYKERDLFVVKFGQLQTKS